MTTKQSHASRYADEMSRCAARHACRCSQRGSGSCKLVYARSKQRSMTNRPTARDRQNSTERPRRILTERQQHHRRTNRGWDQCLSQAFLPPRKKNLQSTLKRLPNCVLEMFFSAGTMNYKRIAETFFLQTINTETYSSLSNQNGANLCLKCAKTRLVAALRADPLGELMHFPRPPSCSGRCLLVRRHLPLQLGGLGKCISSPSGSARSRPPNAFWRILGTNLHRFDCLMTNKFLCLLSVRREGRKGQEGQGMGLFIYLRRLTTFSVWRRQKTPV